MTRLIVDVSIPTYSVPRREVFVCRGSVSEDEERTLHVECEEDQETVSQVSEKVEVTTFVDKTRHDP